MINDYLPKKAYNNLDYFDKIDSNTIIGNAKIKIIEDNNGSLKFKVSKVNGKTQLELPRLYYLGYKITDENNNIIKYSESKHGLINVKVKNGNYKIKYSGTVLYKICVITKGLLILIICLLTLNKIFIMKKVKDI